MLEVQWWGPANMSAVMKLTGVIIDRLPVRRFIFFHATGRTIRSTQVFVRQTGMEPRIAKEHMRMS